MPSEREFSSGSVPSARQMVPRRWSIKAHGDFRQAGLDCWVTGRSKQGLSGCCGGLLIHLPCVRIVVQFEDLRR